jgi:hypothetical protein
MRRRLRSDCASSAARSAERLAGEIMRMKSFFAADERR